MTPYMVEQIKIWRKKKTKETDPQYFELGREEIQKASDK